MMKNLTILILKLIFFILTFLKNLWQGICSCIYFALVVINLEIVLKKFLGLIDLLRAQTLYIYKITEVIIVYEDKNFMLVTF